MKLFNNIRVKKYVEEYISLGTTIGYFNSNQAMEFKNKILNMDIEVDNSLPGDAFCDKSKIIINENRVFGKTEENTCLILFHEFTHLCSNMHEDILKDENKSLIKKLSKNANLYTDTNYMDGSTKTKKGDVNNPFTYIVFGGLLIDEVVAEHVSNEMVKLKFNKPSFLNNRVKKCGNNVIEYKTHLDYYGIGETLVDEFSKTLFLKNNCKNLDGLSKEIFKKDFVYDLIHQHYENEVAFNDLIEELAHMGVIAFNEEQMQGRYNNRGKISQNLVYNSYYKLKELFRIGRENRENIPVNIPIPPFMQ